MGIMSTFVVGGARFKTVIVGGNRIL